MWVSKVPNYDAYGLFRALHSCTFISVIELPRIPAYCPKLFVKTDDVQNERIPKKTLLRVLLGIRSFVH